MYTSTANPVSEDVKDMLETSSSGLGLIFKTNLFVAIMEDEPDDAVCVVDSGGLERQKYALERPRFQIRVRSNVYLTGAAMCRDISYWLHHRNNEVWNGTRYIQITLVSEPNYLGVDDDQRHEWSINFLVMRSGI